MAGAPSVIRLRWLPEEYAVSRRAPTAALPAALFPAAAPFPAAAFVGLIRTRAELSIIAPAALLAPAAGGDDAEAQQLDGGWAALEVRGPMPFDLVGIMAQLSAALTAAGVSLLAQSSYDTDYIFVKADKRAAAAAALVAHGCVVE
jgi:hypothetical protein